MSRHLLRSIMCIDGKTRQVVLAMIVIGMFATGAATRAAEPRLYKNPYPDPHDFFVGVYAADRWKLRTDHVRIAVIPHHLVSSEAMAVGIRLLDARNLRRIILLSPDHFHRCPTQLCTTEGIFKTWFGDVVLTLPTSLRRSARVTAKPELFEQEHGVHAVLPFIAHYHPDIPVVPLVLSQRLPWKGSSAQSEFRRLLLELMDGRTALVISSDFSHYLTLSASDRMDERTEDAILKEDLGRIAALHNPDQSDCPGCLWLAASIAKEKKQKPTILLHTNSARILREPTITQTTSHYAIVYRSN